MTGATTGATTGPTTGLLPNASAHGTGTADVLASMLGFARALRAAGVAADRARLTGALEALDHLDPGRADDVYWATRLTLCAEPEDLPRFDAVFELWFRGVRPTRRVNPNVPPPQFAPALRPVGEPGSADELDTDDDVVRTAASDTEQLRHRDLAVLAPDQRAEVNRLIALLAPRTARRRTRRRRPGGSHRVDVARTVRAMLRDGGEPALRYTRARVKPRRTVLLVDVSGSMSPYADGLLRFGHALVRTSPAHAEVFTLGTRLTRITRQLRLRDPDQALQAAAGAIPDWSGGTRLGESLRAFLDLWGQRGTARRAVVVVVSDGWERGDCTLLGEQMARLARLAHRVVWVNPHKGKDGFAPATGGMVAALPHLDALVAGHSLEALTQLAEVIGRA